MLFDFVALIDVDCLNYLRVFVGTSKNIFFVGSWR